MGVLVVETSCDPGNSLGEVCKRFVDKLEVVGSLQISLQLARKLFRQLRPGMTLPALGYRPLPEVGFHSHRDTTSGRDLLSSAKTVLHW